MENDQIFKRLLNQGLSESAAKVYLVLLERRSAALSELQKTTGIRQNKIGEVVNSLVRLGFCSERRVGRRRYFDILKPETAFSSIKKGLESRINDLDNLAVTLNKVYKEAKKTQDLFEYVEILHGRDNIHRRFCRLVNNTKREIVGFSRPPYVANAQKKVEEETRILERFVSDGGVGYWINELNHPEDKWVIPGLERGQKAGAHFRVAEKLPLKMMVFDEKKVLFAKNSSLTCSGKMTQVIIKHEAIGEAFKLLFKFFWEQSIDLDEWKRRYLHSK